MSDRDNARIMVGVSCCGDLGTLQTLKSPSAVWVASMSVFCLEEVPCHASPVIRDGAREVVRVCRIVKAGLRVAIRMEPLRYLAKLAMLLGDRLRDVIPDRKGAIVACRSNSGDGIENCPRTDVLVCSWLKQYDGTLDVTYLRSAFAFYHIPASDHLPKAMLPFRIKCATLIGSYATKRAISRPVRMSHTTVEWPAS